MKRASKLVTFLLVSVLLLSIAAGCAGNSTSGAVADSKPAGDSQAGESAEAGETAAASDVKISLLNSKGGVLVDALNEMASQYKDATGVEIEILNTPDGGSPFEKISTMYNSGNPPTIAMLDPTDVLTIGPDKAVDLSGEKWLEETGDLAAGVDGTIYGFPFCVEGKGLIYNKTAIEAATKESFDASSLKNITDLENLFKKMQAGGMEGPMLIIKEDWSLGAHYLQSVYESQGKGTKEDIEAFLAKLKAGEVKLMENDRFNQYMDTFDVLNTYNYKRIVEGDPISGDYQRDVLSFTEGDAGIYFNGNWSWADSKEFAENEDYGMMPLFTNAADTDFANTSMECWASKHLMIDREKASAEQQQAAKDFLNWLVYDELGQKLLVETLNLVPASKNNTFSPADPLSASVQQFVNSGNIFAPAIVPGDHWSVIGAAMQKYLAGQIDRAALAADIEAYWINQANK